VRRHEALRTSFAEDQGRPLQYIHPPQPVKVQIIELEEQAEKNQGEGFTRLIREQVRAPFDISRGPLLRAVPLRLHPKAHVLTVLVHDIACDGWSLSIFTTELGELYEAYCQGKSSPLKGLPIQYADYAVWQRQWLEGDALKKQLEYWRKQLDGVKTLDLP